MGAPNEYFVRPVNGSDVADGTSHETAWQTIEYAISQIVRDATDGDRLNICSEGVCDAPVGGILITSDTAAPFVLQGYTATPGDGGMGVINGNNDGPILTTSQDGIILQDLKLYNTGSQVIANVDDWCRVVNCWFDTTTTDALRMSDDGIVVGCRFTDIGGIGVRMGVGGRVSDCYFQAHASDSARQFTTAVSFLTDAGSDHVVENCVFSLADSTSGISSIGTNTSGNCPKYFQGNSFLYAAGAHNAGAAIKVTTDYGAGGNVLVANNLIEGAFIGVDLSAAATRSGAVVAHNSEYNCGTGYTLGDAVSQFNNETLSDTPFSKDGAISYANRATYFGPVNIGDVFGPLGGHARNRGAIQARMAGAAADDPTLIAQYKMQDNNAVGTVNDNSQSNNNATLSSGTTAAISVSGPNASVPLALNFASVTASMTLISFGEGTITFWAKRPDTSAVDNVVGSVNDSSRIHFQSGNHTLQFTDQGGAAHSLATGVTTTDWHHYGVVVQQDPDQSLLYVDGVLAGALSPNVEESGAFDRIAHSLLPGSSSGRLQMANVKIYTGVRTAFQILADYEEAV